MVSAGAMLLDDRAVGRAMDLDLMILGPAFTLSVHP